MDLIGWCRPTTHNTYKMSPEISLNRYDLFFWISHVALTPKLWSVLWNWQQLTLVHWTIRRALFYLEFSVTWDKKRQRFAHFLLTKLPFIDYFAYGKLNSQIISFFRSLFLLLCQIELSLCNACFNVMCFMHKCHVWIM